MTQLVTAGFVQRPVIVGQQEQRSFVEVFPSPALVTLFPGQNRRGHIHCRARVTSIRRSALGQRCTASGKSTVHDCDSLECREPALKLSPEVRRQIGIDITDSRARSTSSLTICWTESSAPISLTTFGIGEAIGLG